MKFSISTHFYTRRFVHPLKTGHGIWKEREGILIKLESEKGTGFGEIAPIPFFQTETVDEARSFIGSLGEIIDAENLQIPESLPCTAFALSSAIAQINQSKETKTDKVFSVAGLLPSGLASKEALVTKTASGFKIFKWKMGVHSFEKEAQIFDDLISNCNHEMRFRLDANASMDKATLEKWMQYAQKYRSQIEFFEQPMSVGEEFQMRELSAKYSIPIALDESLNGPSGKQWLDQDNWQGLFVIKPSAFGSIDILKNSFSKLGTRCILSSSFETSIGLGRCLELALSLRNNSYALGFDTQSVFADDYSLNQSLPSLSLLEVKQHSKSIITNVF